jgi:hypothetical protein
VGPRHGTRRDSHVIAGVARLTAETIVVAVPRLVRQLYGIGQTAFSNVSPVCPPDEARRRIKRIQQLGFDEVLLARRQGCSRTLSGYAIFFEV